MKDLTVKMLANGAEVIWAVPTGGFGHAADEQPLPYIRYNGKSLTARYGGDESITKAGYESLPLPSFQLLNDWPSKQKFFNLFRRRINIYWRNLFKTLCRNDGKFLFSEQLNYKKINNGFYGVSPVANHKRFFEIKKNEIKVIDEVTFNFTQVLGQLKLSYIPEPTQDLTVKTEKHSFSIIQADGSSSTGDFNMNVICLERISVKRGQRIQFSYSMVLNNVL